MQVVWLQIPSRRGRNGTLRNSGGAGSRMGEWGSSGLIACDQSNGSSYVMFYLLRLCYSLQNEIRDLNYKTIIQI